MQESINTANIIFPVSALYIQLDTNIGDKEKISPTGDTSGRDIQLFKRSMIKMPKMDTQPILKSEYPFFTKHVRYPSSIERETWKAKYEFFFNRELFVNRLRREIEISSDIYRERLTSSDESEADELYEWMQETEKLNVMITLRALFPIPEVFGKTLKNSYDHILKPGANSRVFWDVNIQSTMNIFGFMYKFGIVNKEKEEYFINIGGKRYTVDDVVWENDLINHPVYRKFLGSQRETYEEVARSATEVEEKYRNYLTKMDDDLKNMMKNDSLQKQYFAFFGNYVPPSAAQTGVNPANQYDVGAFDFLIKLKTTKDADLDKQTKESGEFNLKSKLLLHKHVISDYYKEYKDFKTTNEIEQSYINILKTSYAEMDKLYDRFKSNVNSINNDESEEVKKYWEEETESSYYLEHLENPDDNDTASHFYKNIEDKYFADLKSDTIFMLRMHIYSKHNKPGRPQTIYGSNSFVDRNTIVDSVTDKLRTLSGETGENAANLIISIKDDFDTHQQLHSNEGISVFMERDYELFFERLLKVAVEIKASSIVLKFAKNNIPMNLTGKKPDGTNVSPINQRINKFIMDFFGTEANINNKLSTNVNDVFEPIRKTSNIELYKVLKLFKFGDLVVKREHKLSNSEIEEYRDVLDNIHSQYISLQSNRSTRNFDEYLYTGVDEVKSIAQTTSAESKQEPEIRRNVQEIYVRMDLVDADKFEKTKRASCKLLDKELEQEFLYLVDPRNKNNTSLSRFRNLDFDSIFQTPMNVETAVKYNNAKPNEEKEMKKTGGLLRKKMTRRIRHANRANTRKFH